MSNATPLHAMIKWRIAIEPNSRNNAHPTADQTYADNQAIRYKR
jgi:hypothetical protein